MAFPFRWGLPIFPKKYIDIATVVNAINSVFTTITRLKYTYYYCYY